MQLPQRLTLPRPAPGFEAALDQELQRHVFDLARLLNKGLSFADNHNGQLVSYVTDAVANTEDPVAHSLKRVPTGFLVVNRDKAGIVYSGSTAWTTTTISLKCSVASVAVTLWVF